MKKAVSLLLVLALCFSLASCAVEIGGSGKLRVVCTLFPMYDFVRSIAGDAVENTLLLPVGTESHSYEPTPTDILKISKSDVFLYVGDEMETFASGVMSEIDTEKTTVLNLSGTLGLTLSHHADHDEDGIDPHIWTNPVYAMRMVEVIRDTLMQADAENASLYSQNAGVLLSELKRLDGAFREVTQNAERKTIVFGSRFAMRNFTAEYGLTAVAAFDSCTEESEPSAAAMASVMKAIRENSIPVVFYEELIAPTTAETIASEVGVKTALFHSCHNLTREEFDNGETYVSLMRQNLENLMEALNG